MNAYIRVYIDMMAENKAIIDDINSVIENATPDEKIELQELLAVCTEEYNAAKIALETLKKEI